MSTSMQMDLKNGSDWNNAFTNLASALNIQTGCTNVREIRIKEGTYYQIQRMIEHWAFKCRQILL